MDMGSKFQDLERATVLAWAGEHLTPGEQMRFVGTCTMLRPLASHIVLTDSRFLGLQDQTLAFSAAADDIVRLDFVAAHGTVTLALRSGGSITIAGIPIDDMALIEQHLIRLQSRGPKRDTSEPPPRAPLAPTPLRSAVPTIVAPPSTPPPPTGAPVPIRPAPRICGKSLRGPAQRIVDDLSEPGETPWLILNPAGATGALVAFDDRLAIIKAGAVTGLLAGAAFGNRQAVIYFRDITGIEFNAGMLTGVLEVLTASYQGTANKDFWKGTLSGRNSDSNDPFTLSNTLPMAKSEFQECKEHVAELRRRISESKQTVIQPQIVMQANETSFADQLEKLAALHGSGALSAEEFAAAKQRLLHG